MRKNRQLICHKGHGDCFRACMTSVLDLPNSSKLPNVDDKDWHLKWMRLLIPCGIMMVYEHKAFWRTGFWIASVKSKNFEDTGHAIIMDGTKVWFDPSPKLKYETGTDLLGSNLVNGGWYFEVTDFSKLKNLHALRRRFKK